MRLRNVKNKDEIMKNSSYLVVDYKKHIGKWNQMFSNNNPIYIEIGMGKGDFIIENAIRYSNINFIGIEKYDSVIARALEKIPDNLNNLLMIRGNALEIDDIFSNEVECIYLNFSDPWPKKRQIKRRLTSEVFLKKYDNIFKKDALIIQKTDNRNLFEYSLESLSNYNYKLYDISLDLHKSNESDNIMSEYEKKFVQNNNIIYRLKACKKK